MKKFIHPEAKKLILDTHWESIDASQRALGMQPRNLVSIRAHARNLLSAAKKIERLMK